MLSKSMPRRLAVYLCELLIRLRDSGMFVTIHYCFTVPVGCPTERAPAYPPEHAPAYPRGRGEQGVHLGGKRLRPYHSQTQPAGLRHLRG